LSDADPEAPKQHAELIEDGGRPALAIDGAIQSVAVHGGVAPSGYWPAMLPDRAPRDALLLGLGGGTLVHLLMGTYGPLPIVGVDDDPAVVALGRAHFALDQPNLEIVVADAFAYAAACPSRFDLVCVDLFRDGQIPARVCASSFLTRVRGLLRPGGLATFNLARDRRAGDRLRQLSRHFVVVRRILVGFNLVVHCALVPPAGCDDQLESRALTPGGRRTRPSRARRSRPP
jgi:spermidine synthase